MNPSKSGSHENRPNFLVFFGGVKPSAAGGNASGLTKSCHVLGEKVAFIACIATECHLSD